MGHGGRERKKREVERLSRGQSNDLLIQLENAGMTPHLATRVVEGDPTVAPAMIEVIRAAADVDFGLVEKWNPERLEEDGAAQLKLQFEGWYSRYGFSITAPKPNVTPAEIMLRRILGYGPFYVPKRTKSFDVDKLAIVSQCVRVWLRCEQEIKREDGGYWFWGEIVRGGPFLERRRRRDGMFTVTRANIEEYVIMWLHERDADSRRPFDTRNAHAMLRDSSDQHYAVANDLGSRLEVFLMGCDYQARQVCSRATDRIPDAT